MKTTLILALAALALVLFCGTAKAAHDTTANEAQIIAQVTPPTTACTGVVNPPDPSYGNKLGFPTLTAGNTYLLFVAGAADSSAALAFGFHRNGTGTLLWQFDNTPQITNSFEGNAHLMSFGTITGSGKNAARWYIVRHTAAVTDAYWFDGGDYFVYNYAFTGFNGHVGNFTVKSTNPDRCGDPNAFRIGGTAFTNTASFPPSAPTLTGTANYLNNGLSWTSGGTVLGYNLTRVSPSGSTTTFILGASPLTYTDVVTEKGMWRYNVTAWNGGGQATSNNVFINATYPPLADTLLGDIDAQSAALFGSSSEDAKKATKFFFGLLLLIGTAGVLGMLFGALVGGITGIAVTAFLAISGWWPAWILVFLGVGIAAFVMLMMRREGSA